MDRKTIRRQHPGVPTKVDENERDFLWARCGLSGVLCDNCIQDDKEPCGELFILAVLSKKEAHRLQRLFPDGL